MLDRKIVKDLVGYSGSERPSKDIRGAQDSEDENFDQNYSRTCTEIAKREDAWFLSTMGSAQNPSLRRKHILDQIMSPKDMVDKKQTDQTPCVVCKFQLPRKNRTVIMV